MHCPKCGSTMGEIRYEGVGISTCDGCGGEFVGGDEMVHIVNTREERFAEAAAMAISGMKPMFGVPGSEREGQRQCPACTAPMTVVNYGGDSGVFVDRCDGCGGMWLDQHELENVQLLMERWADEAPADIKAIAGQLESARQRAAAAGDDSFSGSRFAFVNALMNRLLDVA